MSLRSRVLVPAVLALVVGASVPAIADDATHDPGQAVPVPGSPSEEPTEAPSSDSTEPASDPTEEPAPEAPREPAAAPTTEPTSPTPQPRRAQPKVEKRLTAAGGVTDVTTFTQLRQALSTCAAGDVVRLAANISVSDQIVSFGCDATLDLAGFELSLPGLLVSTGTRATIDDSVGGGRLTSTSRYGLAATSELTIAGGTVTATGAYSVAGLSVPANATLNITGGTVTATGGSMSAGIGGNGWGDSGTINISGGTVNATGGFQGAGIGSGYNRTQGPISITGGTVTAVGRGGQFSTTDEGGAGIGPSDDGRSGGPIVIGEHATVTATGGPLASAIGYGGDAFDYGATTKANVTINGTVRTNGILNTYNGIYTIGATGRVLGLESDPQAGPVLTGSGTIVNNGAIRPTSVASTVKVNNHHFTVSYNLASGTAGPGGTPSVKIYAPTLRAAGVALPARPTRSGHVFDGWHRSASRISETTDLGTGSTNGSAVAIGLSAQWQTVNGYLTANLGSGCTPGSIVRLPEDITSDVPVPIACTLTLDLNGQGLTAPGVTIASEETLTVDDSQGDGTLTSTSPGGAGIGTTGAALVVDGGAIEATGGRRSAGIGGAEGGAPGTITINGGEVTATGGASGSGIGSGHQGPHGTIRITGGTVDATSAGHTAGIGGGSTGTDGSITITGGTVDAQGGAYGSAGIGSGEFGTPVDIAITGGTVTSTGGATASGIGGGGRSPAGDITISGGTVDATSGSNGSAIGPGSFAGFPAGSSEGSLTVSGGAVVTATGAGDFSGGTGGTLSRLARIDITAGTLTASGTQQTSGLGGSFRNSWPDVTIGAGATVTSIDGPAYPASASGTPSFPRGRLQVDGTLRLPSSVLNVDRFTSARIGATGQVLGTVADPTAGGAITGSRVALDNHGTIALSDVTAPVTGHHYAVSAGSDTVTIYGPTVAAGHRSLPSDPTRGIDVFTGWTHDGDPFTSTSTLPGTSADGAAVPVPLTATWDEGVAAFDRPTITVTAGDPATLDLTLTDGAGDPVAVDPADWTITTPAGASLTHTNGAWQLIGTTAGTGTVTASTEVGGRTYGAELEVTVNAAVLSELVLTSSGTAAQGGTITLAAEGRDEYGNTHGDVTADATFASSSSSDVIDGADASFTQSGRRTFTATHANGTTATLEVDVAVTLDEVAAMELSFTGTARQGEAIELSATGSDRFGNDLGDLTRDVTFTSSVSSDVVDGNRITFPSASPHTLTATHANGTKTSLTVEVEAVPAAEQAQARLAETGGTMSAWWLVCGLALVLVGGGLVGRVRRR